MLSDAELRKKYGITGAEFQRILQRQGGTCAICHCHQRYQSLSVDHCHKTKKVRGLLCTSCNRAIGYFYDSPLRMRNAAEYIERSRQPQRGELSKEPSTLPETTGHSLPISIPPARINELDV